jgi:hypothetical protein
VFTRGYEKKVAGATSSDLRPIWLPTLDNLRNLLLTPTKEMIELPYPLLEATQDGARATCA